MSTIKTIKRCDKCGTEVETSPSGSAPAGWKSIYYGFGATVDLCSSCFPVLKAWLDGTPPEGPDHD